MKIEIRSKNEAVIEGYVNVVERRSERLSAAKSPNAPGDFEEIIKAGAFSRSLERRPNVKLKFNHAKAIGETGKNLELREDSIGLYAKAVVTDNDVISAASNGQLTGWSFGMQRPKSSWDKPDGGEVYIRSISDLDLLEVSILTKKPAYPATSIEIRDGEETTYEVRFKDDKDISVSDTAVKSQNAAMIQAKKREIEIIKMKGRINYES